MLEIRALQYLDLASVREHIHSLDAESLTTRFNGLVTKKALNDYLDAINLNRDVLVGGFDASGKLLGVAHVIVFHDGGFPVGELGVTVSEAHRNRGVAFKVICFAKQLLVEQGVTDFYIVAQHFNTAMRHLARKLQGVYRVEDGEIEVHFPIQRRLDRHKVHSAISTSGIESFAGPAIGRDAPILVLLHGAGGEAWQWRKLAMPYLHDRGIESLAISLPAHGRSGAFRVLETLPAVISSIKTAAAGRPVVLVGHSMGGYIAQRCAAELADAEVRGLVLVCSLPPFDLGGLEASSVIQHVRSRMPTARAKALLSQTLEAVGAVNALEVTCPVTCIAAAHDKVVPKEWSIVTANIYGADLLVLDGGHDLLQSFSWRVLMEAISERALRLTPAKSGIESAASIDLSSPITAIIA